MYARTVGDTDLTFIVSGKLWRNSLVMMDKETGSLWSHITGVCMEGEHLGAELPMIPSVQTTWGEWKISHPKTRVLEKSEEVTSSHYEDYFADPDKAGLFRSEWLMEQMSAKTLVHGVTVGVHALAVTDDGFAVGDTIQADLGETPVMVSRGTDGGVRAVRQDTGDELIVRTSFWFAWSGFYPNTLVR